MRGSRAATPALLVALCGCAEPYLARDGRLVFPEAGGRRGASVLTAEGVVFLDHTEVPERHVRRRASDPWRPPTGFLLPPDGVLRNTSTAVPVPAHGLGLALRASDALAPSWGGELLVRLDVLVPAELHPPDDDAASEGPRAPLFLGVVLDDARGEGPGLAAEAVAQLGERDRVAVLDARAARTVLPPLPGSHRTLIDGALQRAALAQEAPRRDVPGALRRLEAWSRRGGMPAARQLLVVTDGAGVSLDPAGVAAALRAAGSRVTALATGPLEERAVATLAGALHPAGTREARLAVARALVPPAGHVAITDLALTFEAVPAPARVLEVSGGEALWSLDADQISLGALRAGEARTEVARVSVPDWVEGETFTFTVVARYRDARTGAPYLARAVLPLRYTSDVERLARERHGDVLAYASALAMVRRLDAAFLGRSAAGGALDGLVRLQAESLRSLAHTRRDPALAEQAEVLSVLLDALATEEPPARALDRDGNLQP